MPTDRSGNPPPLEQDSGLDLERDIGRPLGLVPPAHAVGEIEHRLAREQLRVGDRARRLDAVELDRPPPNGRVAVALDLLDDAHAAPSRCGTESARGTAPQREVPHGAPSLER